MDYVNEEDEEDLSSDEAHDVMKEEEVRRCMEHVPKGRLIQGVV